VSSPLTAVSTNQNNTATSPRCCPAVSHPRVVGSTNKKYCDTLCCPQNKAEVNNHIRSTLAQHMRVRPSVRPSVTSRCCIETTGRIELVFGMEASFHRSQARNLGISKNYGTSLWDFVPNSVLRKFRSGKLIAMSTKLVVFVDGRTCIRSTFSAVVQNFFLFFCL